MHGTMYSSASFSAGSGFVCPLGRRPPPWLSPSPGVLLGGYRFAFSWYGGERASGLGGGGGAVPARRCLPGLPGPGPAGPERRRGAGVPGLARPLAGAAVAALAHELVLLPVLPLVLLAAVEGAAAAAAAQQVLHLPAQLAVLPVSLARTRPAGPTAVIGHGGGGGG